MFQTRIEKKNIQVSQTHSPNSLPQFAYYNFKSKPRFRANTSSSAVIDI